MKTGVAKTLSTTRRAPTACASSATAPMSITSSVGFEIDSRKAALVSGRKAARHWSRSVPSTKRHLDAEARQQRLDDVEARSEQRARRDDVVAGPELAEQRAVHRRHAGRGGEGVLGAFERRHPLLEHPHRRVAVAGVDELVGAGGDEARLGGRRVGVDEALGQEDRLGGLAILAAAGAAVHHPRPRAPVFAHPPRRPRPVPSLDPRLPAPGSGGLSEAAGGGQCAARCCHQPVIAPPSGINSLLLYLAEW